MKHRQGIGAEKTFLVSIILAITGFLGLYTYLPGGMSLYSTDVYFIYIIAFSVFFGVLQILSRGRLNVVSKYLRQGLVLILLVFVEIILSLSRYHQSLTLVLKEASYYFVPTLCFLVFLQYKNKKNIDDYLQLIVKFSLACSICATVYFLLYTYAHIDLVHLSSISASRYRNGTVRFEIGGVILTLGIIISITRLFEKKWTKLDIWNLLFGTYQIIYINKTRSVILYLVITVILSILLQKKVHYAVRTLLIVMIAVLVVYAFLSPGTTESSTTIGGIIGIDAGIRMRFRAIEFYLGQFLEHPLFGMGFISASRDVSGWTLLYGNEGRFYRSDVGAVGLINEFGIAGAIWAVSFIILMYKSFKKHNSLCGRVGINTVNYFVVSLINLSFLDNNRIMIIFFLYMLAYLLDKEEKNDLQTANI